MGITIITSFPPAPTAAAVPSHRSGAIGFSVPQVFPIVIPPAGAVNIKQTEIDFGATPVAEASFVVVDVDVSPSSQIVGVVAYEAPTGKDLDELDVDGLDLKFAPGVGQFMIYARGLDGYVADKFKINYLVG